MQHLTSIAAALLLLGAATAATPLLPLPRAAQPTNSEHPAVAQAAASIP